MFDFESLIENYLQQLRGGNAVELRWDADLWLVADASLGAVLAESDNNRLMELVLHRKPVLLLADERQFLQLVSAYDLTLTASLIEGEGMLLEGILGVEDKWLGPNQSAECYLVENRLLFTLIKRLKRPLVAFRLDPEPDR